MQLIFTELTELILAEARSFSQEGQLFSKTLEILQRATYAFAANHLNALVKCVLAIQRKPINAKAIRTFAKRTLDDRAEKSLHSLRCNAHEIGVSYHAAMPPAVVLTKECSIDSVRSIVQDQLLAGGWWRGQYGPTKVKSFTDRQKIFGGHGVAVHQLDELVNGEQSCDHSEPTISALCVASAFINAVARYAQQPGYYWQLGDTTPSYGKCRIRATVCNREGREVEQHLTDWPGDSERTIERFIAHLNAHISTLPEGCQVWVWHPTHQQDQTQIRSTTP